MNAVNWMVLLFTVLLLATFAVWAVTCFAIDKGAGASYGTANDIQAKVKDGAGMAVQAIYAYDNITKKIKDNFQGIPEAQGLCECLSGFGSAMATAATYQECSAP
jgi:hypothetical protein